MKRIIALMLSGLCCVMLLVACNSNADKPMDTTEQTTSAPETEAPPVPVKVIDAGTSEYTIIRPDRASEALTSAASNLRNDLNGATGSNVKISSDWHKATDVPPERAKEIVVGKCDRPGTEKIAKELRERDFAIVYEGERVYIVGGNDEATIDGINYFRDNFLNNDSKSLTVLDNLSFVKKYDYPLGSVAVDGVNITDYRIVIPADCGLYTSSAAQILSEYFYHNGGISIDVVKDSESATDYEILVGDTNRAESTATASVTLGASEYILAKTGSKIVMDGESYMIGGAVSDFINNYAVSTGVNADIDVKTLPTTLSAKKFEFKEAKNAILLIGDGMGFNHIQSTIDNGVIDRFVARELPNSGSAVTQSYSVITGNAKYTDSAASATALATATKTVNGYVGVDKKLKPLTNVRELAASIGARTAVLTTDVVTGATPGGFLAHVKDRDLTAEIKAQIDELLATKAVDYAVGSIGDGLVAEAARELWSISENGSCFFQMIEEGLIDKKSHSNLLPDMMQMVKRYNSLIAYCVEFTVCHPDTVLIITADHETGTLTYNQQTSTYQFLTTTHSNADVPVFAVGYGTEAFANKVDNTDIAKFIAKIYGADNFGS